MEITITRGEARSEWTVVAKNATPAVAAMAQRMGASGSSMVYGSYKDGEAWMQARGSHGQKLHAWATTVLEQERRPAAAPAPRREAARVVAGQVRSAIYRPDADHSRVGTCRCGRRGTWIAGAGEHLCARHQDDY